MIILKEIQKLLYTHAYQIHAYVYTRTRILYPFPPFTHTHIYIQTSIKYLCVTIIIVLRLSKFFSFFFSLKTAHKILLEKYV